MGPGGACWFAEHGEMARQPCGQSNNAKHDIHTHDQTPRSASGAGAYLPQSDHLCQRTQGRDGGVRAYPDGTRQEYGSNTGEDQPVAESSADPGRDDRRLGKPGRQLDPQDCHREAAAEAENGGGFMA